MEDKLEQIQHLLTLFDQREKLRESSNRKIARFINGTLLTALQELLGLPDEAIVWDEFHAVDTILAIKFTVIYNPQLPMTPFLQLISVTNPSEPLIEVRRTLQIGVPFPTVFLPREEIKMWLMKMAEDTFGAARTPVDTDVTPETPVAAPAAAPSPAGFDPSALTPDQVNQLLYFQQLTKGVKQ